MFKNAFNGIELYLRMMNKSLNMKLLYQHIKMQEKT